MDILEFNRELLLWWLSCKAGEKKCGPSRSSRAEKEINFRIRGTRAEGVNGTESGTERELERVSLERREFALG